jgi:tRNA pseudouridine55 synthase
MRTAAPCGVLVVDKPRGPTSHDVVSRVRRALGTREVGHAGTLDPMATGVLVVAVGEATKLVPWLLERDKGYRATVALGVATDTLDAEGQETERLTPGAALLGELDPSREAATCPLLHEALEVERARTSQIPPAFSAIRQDGVRAHERARRGESVELAPRDVRVLRLAIEGRSADPPRLEVALDASKGYYVRALARDLARSLGTVGHLVALRRTRSGCFGIDEAIAADAPRDALVAALQPLASVAARVLPVARLTDKGAEDARHGRRVSPGDVQCSSEGAAAWFDVGGALVAVGEIDAGGGRVRRGFGLR